MSKVSGSHAAAAAPLAQAAQEEEQELTPELRRRIVYHNRFNIFAAVVQHCLIIQSELALFNGALGGDNAATAQWLAMGQAMVGVVGMFVNQIFAKLSDCVGRKPMFAVGPILQMAASTLALSMPKNIVGLFFARIIKASSITFSGTVMSTAVAGDVVLPEKLGRESAIIQAFVGVAVVIAPFIETTLVKLSGPKNAYRGLMVASLVQLCNSMVMPETLQRSKRKSLDHFQKAIYDSLNPFSFMKIFMGDNRRLKALLAIQTLQSNSDGKCTSDWFQQWSRNHLNWTTEQTRNLVSAWGGFVTAAGFWLHPLLLGKLEPKAYSTFGNLSLFIGLATQGLLPHSALMWLGNAIILPGINGGASHAVKAAVTRIAQVEGYGMGEFAGWITNLRIVMQSADIMLLGFLYARMLKMNIYPGFVWMIQGLVAGGLPQLLVWMLPKEDFEVLSKEEEEARASQRRSK